MDPKPAPATGYRPHPVIEPGHTFKTITEKIASIVLTRYQPVAWIVTTAIGFLFVNILGVSVTYLFLKGIGIWGNNIPVG